MSRLEVLARVVGFALAVGLGSSGARAESGPQGPVGYEEARARFGVGAEAEVRLALWCEARGLSAERVKHLGRAILIDPNNTKARGLLGYVADEQGRWRRPEDLVARERMGAALAEYNAQRDKTAETAEAQWKLALWCERNGLEPEAIAHLTAVTRLDPSRSLAWKHLGYKKHRGRWVTDRELRDELAERKTQDRANRRWLETLGRLESDWRSKDALRRARAESAFVGVTDPRAVPAVMRVLGAGDPKAQAVAVAVLGRIEAPASSRALAELAVASASDIVRRAAAETLRRRDPRDFVGALIARLHETVEYHVKPVETPGKAGEILIEGEKANLARVYSPPAPLNIPATPGSFLGHDVNGSAVLWLASALEGGTAFAVNLRPAITNLLTRPLQSNDEMVSLVNATLGPNSGLAALPFQMRPQNDFATTGQLAPSHRAIPVGAMAAEIERATYELRGQQRDDARAIDRHNAAVLASNDPVVLILQAALGFTPGSTRSDWAKWWNDRRGYELASEGAMSKPTMVEYVTPTYTPRPIDQYQFDSQIGYYLPRRDCFAAGTLVWTLDGLRPIESIQRGDRVLARDPRTGESSYQPVLSAHHNPPSETLRIVLDGETVVTTAIQRFWKARQGWVMARDLAPGDTIRSLGRLARVQAVTHDLEQPVYNLEVAAARDFLVGRAGLLVHDHTPVDDVFEPFDALASDESAAEGTRSGTW